MEEKVTLTFLTLNVCHGGIYMKPLRDFLADQSADLMVFQEINDSNDPAVPAHFRTNAVLRELFPDFHLAFDPGIKLNYLHDKVQVEQGNTTLSRYQIISHELVYFNSQYRELDSPLPGPKPDYRTYPKFMQKVWVQLPHQQLLVINLHGAWDFHGGDTPERRAMAQTILEHAQEAEYVIIAGDSNAHWQTQTIGDLMSRYPSALTPAPKTTFNMKHKTDPGYAVAAVDILLTSPNIEVISSHIPRADVSDHLPLVAMFKL